MTSPATLGATLRARRTELGITQVDLAEKLRCTQSAVSRWELDLDVPQRKNIVALADVLGLDARTLAAMAVHA